MKKFLLISILCIPLIFLCSCSFFLSPDNKKSASPQTDFSKSVDLDRHSVKLALNKSVTVDAKLNIPKQLSSFKMNKVNAHRPLIDSKTAKNFFFKKGTHLTKQLDKGYSSREIGNYDIDLYYNADDSVLSCEKLNIIYSDFAIDSILKCVYSNPELDSYNLDKYSLTDNLPFASREDVFQKIKEAYKTLGNIIMKSVLSGLLKGKLLPLPRRLKYYLTELQGKNSFNNFDITISHEKYLSIHYRLQNNLKNIPL